MFSIFTTRPEFQSATAQTYSIDDDTLLGILDKSIFEHYGHESRKGFLQYVREQNDRLDEIQSEQKRVNAMNAMEARICANEHLWDKCTGDTDELSGQLATLFVNSGEF